MRVCTQSNRRRFDDPGINARPLSKRMADLLRSVAMDFGGRSQSEASTNQPMTKPMWSNIDIRHARHIAYYLFVYSLRWNYADNFLSHSFEVQTMWNFSLIAHKCFSYFQGCFQLLDCLVCYWYLRSLWNWYMYMCEQLICGYLFFRYCVWFQRCVQPWRWIDQSFTDMWACCLLRFYFFLTINYSNVYEPVET